jgi:thiamine-phosphate pyrophosphorylase
MKIVLVSDFNEIPRETFLLNALFDAGLECFHLRKRDYSMDKICNYLDHISPVYYERIVIHSHFDLVESYGLRGVHFKKNYTLHDFLLDMAITANEARNRYRHLSHSVHSLNEIKSNTFAFNYLFLSPVFDSISNKGYNSKIKIQAIRKFFKEEPNRQEVIALSGITADKVEHIAEAGFNGLGLLGYIWVRYKEDGNVAAAVQRFQLVQQKVKALNVSAIDR